MERIRSQCDNHPYLIQLVCKRFLETGDLEETFDQVTTDAMVSHFFSVDFDILSEEERNVLRVIARQAAATSDAIRAQLVAEPGSVAGRLHHLEQLGFVRRNDERAFVLVNAFFRRWLEDRASRAVQAPGGGFAGDEDHSIASVPRGGKLIGSRLLHYRIVRWLGKGGMGDVYGVKDMKLGREVALKLLPPEMAGDRDRLERFRREARALAALNHPSIVTIYAVEAVGDLHFITTELVAGRTLGELIARRLPLATILDLMLPLLEALAAAHARGIIHRDLKPANIMVTDDGRVKLLDFGVALFREARSAVHPSTDPELRTAPGLMVGTLPYVSPEQILGRQVDHRTDLFSVGVVLYEALAGARPFQKPTTEELIAIILTGRPRPLCDIRPDLPPELGHIVSRCLEKDPDARFSTALELHRALDAVSPRRDAARPVAVRSVAGAELRRRFEHLVRRLFRHS